MIEDLDKWVGRERTMSDALHPFQSRALAAALDHAKLPQAGDALLPCWQWMHFLDTPAAANTGADGHPNLGEFLPPAPLPRRMWAAGAMQVERPLRIGVPATRHSRIRSIDAKSGKSGALVFVTVDHTYSQDGAVCLREEQNLVYREMPDGPAPLPPGERIAEAPDATRTVHADPVLLFRYSALTYNGHRIHYDRHYAVEREHYPALVVHGPLLATLLLDLLHREMPGAVLREFRFRAVRPTFDPQPFTLNLRSEGSVLKLWTADHEGYVCMSADATVRT